MPPAVIAASSTISAGGHWFQFAIWQLSHAPPLMAPSYDSAHENTFWSKKRFVVQASGAKLGMAHI
eukprot:8175887-Lingulodinium_polyedra.AAC.1